MWNKRLIPNFKPDIVQGKQLVKKRILPFVYVMTIILVFEAIAFALIWTLGSIDQVKMAGICLSIMHLIALVTWFIIFDIGPANQLKKNNFKDKKNVSILNGHTYYWALKTSGLIRVVINSLFLVTIIAISLVTFLI